MLTLDVVLSDEFDDEKQEFVDSVYKLKLEHSLVSLSKWETEFEVPFLGEGDITPEQTLRYIELMALEDNVPPEVFAKLTDKHVTQVDTYIHSKQTATTFHEAVGGGAGPSSREIITAEIMYYWLVTLSIPFECQYWHLNKLIALVRTCNLKNQPAKKMGRREQIDQRKRLNAERQAKLGTRG